MAERIGVHGTSGAARGRGGFTLVELLVVVGIIAVLIAMFAPALTGARRQAHAVQCLSNQRQILAACMAYASANESRFPFEGWANPTTPGSKVNNWLFNPMVAGLPPSRPGAVKTGLLWPYLKDMRMYRCPVDDGPWQPNSVQNVTSYVMNGALTNYDTNLVRPTPVYRFAADSIITWELPLYSVTHVSVNDGANYPPEGVTLRHNSCTTVGCIDGHAELIRDSEFNVWCQSGPNRLWCSPLRKDGGAALFHASNPIPMYY